MAIQVTGDSRLSKALELHPDVLDYIVSLNPHDFQRLRNPLMRRLMPPRITLARIAAMTKTPILDLLQNIHRTAGLPLDAEDLHRLRAQLSVEDSSPVVGYQEPPEWTNLEPVEIVDLLESDERLDADPLIPIMQAIRGHEAGAVVLIKHKWEPQPLYDIWNKTGVEHHAEQQSQDEWWIFVRKTPTKKDS